jgi:monoamine oxidase
LQEKVLTEALLARPNALNIRKWDDFPQDEDITFAEWVAEQGCTGEYVQAWANFLTIAIVGRESNVVGAHYFLDYVKSGMGYISLMTEGEMGAQSLKIKKGNQST